MPAGGPWWSWASLWPWPWSSCAWVAVLMGYPAFSISLLARGRDFGRLDRIARLVAPGVALVGDDGRDVGIVEVREGRHRRAGLALHHHRDVAGLGAGRDLGSVERGEGGRHALACRLVARGAVGGVELLAR